MLKLTLKNYLDHEHQDIYLERTTYQNNHALALLAYFPDNDGHIDRDYPDVLSINLDGAPDDPHAFYGSSDCPETLKALVNAGFIEPREQTIQGLGTYTLFHITDTYWNKLPEAK